MLLKKIQKLSANFVYRAKGQPVTPGLSEKTDRDSHGYKKSPDKNRTRVEAEGETKLDTGHSKLDSLRRPADTPENLRAKAAAQSNSLRQEGVRLAQDIESFHQALQKFEKNKKGWSVFLRGSPLVKDNETENMKNRLAALKKRAAHTQYARFLDAISIDRPTLWNATAGLFFEKAGEGVQLLTKDVLCGTLLDPASKWLKKSTKNIPVLGIATEVAANIAIDLPSGVIEGAGELVSGISTALAHPVETVKGLGTLVGRDPKTSEWSRKNAGRAWKAMGKSLIAYDHFEKGEIGKGAGKVALNVLLTATGIGAASKGAQGASLAYTIAKASGRSTLRASAKAAGTGTRIFASEFTSGVAKLPGETLSGIGKIAKAPRTLVRSIDEFRNFSRAERLERRMAAAETELQKTSRAIENFTIGDKKVSQLEGMASLTPDELLKIPPDELIKFGITDTAGIQEFLNLRGIFLHRQRLISAKNALASKLVRQRAILHRQELLDDLTKGLRAEERTLFAEAYIDPLTGMMNRSGLNFLKRMMRDSKKVSIASFDGDHFRAINEICGKKFGDTIIQTIGDHFHELTQQLRKQGYEVYAVRMGGEEFTVFGRIPKEVLESALSQMAETLKRDIRGRIRPSRMDKMAHSIFASKYAKDSDGLARAYREIGGSTAGISEVHFPVGAGADTKTLTRQSLQMVDGFLERGKNTTGRGRVYVDSSDIPTASQRAARFSPHNSLDEIQNASMEAIARELQSQVALQRKKLMPNVEAVLDRFNVHSAKRQMLESFFETPPFSMQGAENLSRITGVPVGELRKAKLEYIHAMNEYGTYTGAATMRKLTSLDKTYSAPRTIEIGEFKSINETMGHTHGDTFLAWFYQKVILPAAREVGVSESQIMVAQKGANFFYRMHASASGLQAYFERALKTNYEANLPAFFDTIDAGSAFRYRDIRADWIRRNKTSTVDASLKNADSLTIHHYGA